MTKKTADRKMQGLVHTRCTKQELIMKLALLSVNRDSIPVLTPFEEPLPENDFGFSTNIGMLGETYLDYEIFMLPTNKQDVFLITEIRPF